MQQTTKKRVAMKQIAGKCWYYTGYAHPDGSDRLTDDARIARGFSAGATAPRGYRIVSTTYSTPVLGGGWINHQGTT